MNLEDVLGQVNPYFQKILGNKERLAMLPPKLQESLLTEACRMSNLGVESDEDHRDFMTVLQHVPDVMRMMVVIPQDDGESLAHVAAEVFANRKQRPINSMLKLMTAVADAASELKLPVQKSAAVKWAYPQPFEGNEPKTSYNLNRWMQATRDIYLGMQRGQSQDDAKLSVTKDWDKMESIDYGNWLKFYQERVPEKYPKLAQQYYADDSQPGIMVPNPIGFGALRGNLPHPIGPEGQPPGGQSVPPEPVKPPVDRREIIEEQRAKIVSRLNAAERLLASMDGQDFAGDDQELMLKLLQDLKRKVQIANKVSVRSSLFEDYIYRTANQLNDHGKDKAAAFFYKIAQMDPLGGMDPMGGAPMGGTDMGGGPPGGAPMGSGDPVKDTKEAFQKFFDALERQPGDPDDTKKERERKSKEKKEGPGSPASPPSGAPAPGAPPADLLAGAPPAPGGPPAPAGGPPPPPVATASYEDADIVVEAQVADAPDIPIAPAESAGPPDPRSRAFLPEMGAPPVEPKPPEPSPPPPEAAADISVDEKDLEGQATTDDKTDDVIEAALSKITIQDVIQRLEMLVSIYNQREISRQINILDIMMDRIGLASFFPALGEAMGKALDSNQYIATRLEDILAKLKGSMESSGTAEWLEPTRTATPESEEVRKNLETKEQEEEARKERRKQKEIDRAMGREPEPGAAAPAGVGAVAPEELAAPAAVAPPPARRIPTR